MNPYPQYLKALEMKTDAKGHFQAEKTSILREGDDDEPQPAPRQTSARRAMLSFCYKILTLRVTASYMRT